VWVRALVVAVACAVAAAGCAYTQTDITPKIPENAQSSKIFAADGTLITTLHGPQNRQEVTLDEELHLLDLYVDIMRARFDDRLEVAFDVEPAARSALVPQLLLQPLVENAIRHGAGPDARASIDVRASRAGEGLRVSVRDRGPGLGEAPSPTGFGVGLTNTAERLERLYGLEHGFALRDAEGGGLAIDITIPFRTAAPASA